MQKSTRFQFFVPLMALLTLVLWVNTVHAFNSFGNAVDNACRNFNGTTPYQDQSGDNCTLCHFSDRGRQMDPEWSWYLNGQLTNFCPDVPASNAAPNGLIDMPVSNETITVGQAVNFMGTGTDPDDNFPLSYRWDFGGGASNTSVEDPGGVTFNSAGTFTVTFTVTDSLGARDPSAATRRITVKEQLPSCTDRDDDTFSVEGGACGQVDCNDTDAGINPGTTESCNDGIDNNCNGLIDADDPGAVGCPISEGCMDFDGDQFSPEGGICGPIDCDDLDQKTNPSAVELCSDDIDNDCDGLRDHDDPECNGGNCLSRLFAGGADVTFVTVLWNPDTAKVKVVGKGLPAGTPVDILDAESGDLLGKATANNKGRFRLNAPVFRVPCALQAQVNGSLSSSVPVDGTPADCGDGGAIALRITKALWRLDNNVLRVLGNRAPVNGTVQVMDADTGDVLGETQSNLNGAFKYREKRAVPPCRVTVGVNGLFIEAVDVVDAEGMCIVPPVDDDSDDGADDSDDGDDGAGDDDADDDDGSNDGGDNDASQDDDGGDNDDGGVVGDGGDGNTDDDDDSAGNEDDGAADSDDEGDTDDDTTEFTAHPISSFYASDRHTSDWRNRPEFCQSCHGADLSGTALSATLEPRVWQSAMRQPNGSRIKSYQAGDIVGCADCHGNPLAGNDDDDDDSDGGGNDSDGD